MKMKLNLESLNCVLLCVILAITLFMVIRQTRENFILESAPLPCDDDGNTDLTNFDKITHLYSDTGTYEVSLTVESDSGCTDIASQTVIISPVFSIYIPNAFTPNNDLYNDYFLPIVDGVLQYELNIYNREGQRIFRSNDFSNDYLSCINNNCPAAWDGKINNGKYASKGIEFRRTASYG